MLLEAAALRSSAAQRLDETLCADRQASVSLRRLHAWLQGDALSEARRIAGLRAAVLDRFVDHLISAEAALRKNNFRLARSTLHLAVDALTDCMRCLVDSRSKAFMLLTHSLQRDALTQAHVAGADEISREEWAARGMLLTTFASQRLEVVAEDSAAVMRGWQMSVWRESHSSYTQWRALHSEQELQTRGEVDALAQLREEESARHDIKYADQRLDASRLVEQLRLKARQLEHGIAKPTKLQAPAITKITFNLDDGDREADTPLVEWCMDSVRSWLAAAGMSHCAFDFRNVGGRELHNLKKAELLEIVGHDIAEMEALWPLIERLRVHNEEMCVRGRDAVRQDLRAALQRGCSEDVRSILVSAPGLNPNVPFDDGVYPFDLAGHADSADCIQALVEAGALPDVHCLVPDLFRRLCLAGRAEAVNTLALMGADTQELSQGPLMLECAQALHAADAPEARQGFVRVMGYLQQAGFCSEEALEFARTSDVVASVLL